MRSMDPPPRGWLTRADYLPAELEQRYARRDDQGRLTLVLVRVADQLAICSAEDSRLIVNPRGPGLRDVGLYATQVRGKDYQGRMEPYRSADLRAGCWVDLTREPDNPHDPRAVVLRPAGSSEAIGYVQRGRVAAAAQGMDSGEDWAAISLQGPGPGSVFDSCRLLVGRRADLQHMVGST